MKYSEIKAEIMAVPMTWLPGLLVAVVRATIDKKVLKPGGAARIAQEVEDEALGQREDVASGSSPVTGWTAPPVPAELMIALSRCVHDRCSNVPHDIGITLGEVINAYSAQSNDQAQRPEAIKCQ